VALSPLPSYMDRIRAHLLAERSMDEAKATSTAIATATLFCKSGASPNLPVHVNAASRAEACAAVAELRAAKTKGPEPVAERVTDAAWDGSPSRFTDAEYAASCVLDRGPSVASVQERYSLPILEPDGTLNRNAVHAAAARIGQVSAAPKLIAAAARKLVAAYRQLNEQPPESLVKLAAVGAVAAAAGGGKKPSEQRGLVEERSAPDEAAPPRIEGNRLFGLVPTGVRSHDLGGWFEQLEPGCLREASMDGLVLTLNHGGLPLGRFPTTLSVEERDDGLAWSCELPDGPTGQDVRAAVARGDLVGSSWRMVVSKDRWEGDVRHVERIAELRDVSVVTSPAYATRVELRSRPTEIPTEEDTVDGEEQEVVEERAADDGAVLVEERAAPGGLRVEQRAEQVSGDGGSLLGNFRRAGWEPGRRAEIAWQEFLDASESRALSFAGDVADVSILRRQGVALGSDRRYAWPAFPNVAVDPGATSVQVVTQTGRTLPAASAVVRAIDAVTEKPEADSELDLVAVALKQVAAVQKGIPNVLLHQDQIRTVIGTDLRLALNEGLDKLVLDALAGAGFQAPGTDPLLASIRKAMTTIIAAGYNPDTVILTPANAEGLDLDRSSGSEKFWTFGAGRFAPGDLFGLNVRVSKSTPAPIVCDASAFGNLYVSPISLATFEENAGSTNSSTMRMEGHAVFGVEREDAAVRIAAS
jgi:HK97 family phage prohead protease